MDKSISFLGEPTDFSLVQGGPLFQLFRRAHLLKPPIDLLLRRIVVISAITWLPLLVLTLVSGRAFGGPGIPFLYDLGAHTRFLLGVPLLIAAEVIVHRRIKSTVGQFLDRDIILHEDRPRFESYLASAMSLRNSVLAESFLLALTFVVGPLLEDRQFSLQATTWYADRVGDRLQPTPAGYWYVFVSLTILRFLLLRWYYRLLIWYRFLWQVSGRIRLRLDPLHPDRAAGLGFLSESASAFTLVLFAHMTAFAGIWGGKIWHEGATLPQFELEIVAWLLFLLMLPLIPLTFFIGQLAEARRAGLREYGIIASRYVREFRRKWIEDPSAKDAALVGSSDIQSLADLSNSFEVVKEMRLVPFGRALVLHMALYTALPIAPLTLTMIPLEEIVDRALGMLL